MVIQYYVFIIFYFHYWFFIQKYVISTKKHILCSFDYIFYLQPNSILNYNIWKVSFLFFFNFFNIYPVIHYKNYYSNCQTHYNQLLRWGKIEFLSYYSFFFHLVLIPKIREMLKIYINANNTNKEKNNKLYKFFHK